ncbi:arabinofuranosidase catalytic domain-containing protein [Streptomyces griseofuscus]|uniref:arabinofuranosidase catalytic domain-containing protein n=1 Tax=Streptomyces griseofuscus TaxID=146922 RepID=UPI0036CADCF3
MAGIILGTGGDNSNWNRGTFFEGVMVSGHPSDAAENAVQADIVSVGYAGGTDVPNGSQGTVTGPGGQVRGRRRRRHRRQRHRRAAVGLPPGPRTSTGSTTPTAP